MPKGGHHHLHITAACPVEYLIDLTYEDFVYYSEREGQNMFKVSKNGPPSQAGFIKCNSIRNFKYTAEDFDNQIKNKILLNKEEISS